MALITITSDLGTRDFYLAALKGALISQCGQVPVIDVTHSIKPFDIKEAAFTIRNAYSNFPKNTVHIIHVNAADGRNRLLAAEANNHFFITFDSGLLSLAFGKTPQHTYQVNEELLENNSLLFNDAIAKATNLLLKEFKFTDFAHPVHDTVNYKLLQPLTSQGSIRGTVLHIDNFGNAIVNITNEMFKQFIGEKRFTVMANIGSSRAIAANYTDVDEGDMVCLFNSAGYLEIAINRGRADNLLGLKIDSPVLVAAD